MKNSVIKIPMRVSQALRIFETRDKKKSQVADKMLHIISATVRLWERGNVKAFRRDSTRYNTNNMNLFHATFLYVIYSL